MNSLIAKFWSVPRSDSTTMTLLGGQRVYRGWPSMEVPLTTATPAYICYTHRIHPRNPEKIDGHERGMTVTYDIFATTDFTCTAVHEQLITLLHGKVQRTSTRVASCVLAGAAQFVPEPDRGCKHLSADFEVTQIL